MAASFRLFPAPVAYSEVNSGRILNYSSRTPANPADVVKDYQASIEKLRKDAAEAALVRDLATDTTKRELFDRLHKHFNRLADEVEEAMKSTMK